MTWRERIVRARAVGKFTGDDARLAFGSWHTCAVGEQHAQHPMVVRLMPGSFEPADLTLSRLGNSLDGFGWAVWTGDIDRAERLLDAIEDRVLTLKREGTDDVA